MNTYILSFVNKYILYRENTQTPKRIFADIKFMDIRLRSLIRKLIIWLNTLSQKEFLVRIEGTKKLLEKFVHVLFWENFRYSFQTFKLCIKGVNTNSVLYIQYYGKFRKYFPSLTGRSAVSFFVTKLVDFQNSGQ